MEVMLINRLFLWLLVLSNAAGCARLPVAPALAGSGVPASSNTYTYLALGDSYTIGEGAPAAERWPAQLAGLLTARGVAVAGPTYIARTGWTTAELQGAIDAARPAATYGLVSLQIGVNNQYRGQPLARYQIEFRALLQQAIGFAGGQPGHVVVLSIPDWGQSPYGQREGHDPATVGLEIDRFNAVAQDECRQAHVAYVNITDLTRAAAGSSSQFTREGLHYSGLQMRQWAARTLPVAQALLQ